MVYEACAAQLLELLIYGAHAGQRARQAMQMLQGEIVVLLLAVLLRRQRDAGLYQPPTQPFRIPDYQYPQRPGGKTFCPPGP